MRVLLIALLAAISYAQTEKWFDSNDEVQLGPDERRLYLRLVEEVHEEDREKRLGTKESNGALANELPHIHCVNSLKKKKETLYRSRPSLPRLTQTDFTKAEDLPVGGRFGGSAPSGYVWSYGHGYVKKNSIKKRKSHYGEQWSNGHGYATKKSVHNYRSKFHKKKYGDKWAYGHGYAFKKSINHTGYKNVKFSHLPKHTKSWWGRRKV